MKKSSPDWLPMRNFRIIIESGMIIAGPQVHISSPGRKYLIHYTIQPEPRGLRKDSK